jgi:hypothetical protein
MSHEETHRERAMIALDDARHGRAGPENVEVAQVYAMTAIAEATLAVHDILIEVRDRIEGR